MADIVLIHGAFRGGWTWERVFPILNVNGHRVLAPSLTGAGCRARELSPTITLDIWAKDIVFEIEKSELYEVVLVGHSQGGIVAQAAAEIAPDRVSKIVFLDSPVLGDGESAIDIVPSDLREKFGEPKRNTLVQPIPAVETDDISAEDAVWINERLTAVPTNPGFAKLKIDRSSNISHTYIFCSKTPPFFPASFSRVRFDAENVPYILIDAPHDCMISHPNLVAETIIATLQN